MTQIVTKLMYGTKKWCGLHSADHLTQIFIFYIVYIDFGLDRPELNVRHC